MRAKGLGQERAGSIASGATTDPGTRLWPWPLHRGDCRNHLLADWHRENADVSCPRETASLLARPRDAKGKWYRQLARHPDQLSERFGLHLAHDAAAVNL